MASEVLVVQEDSAAVLAVLADSAVLVVLVDSAVLELAVSFTFSWDVHQT